MMSIAQVRSAGSAGNYYTDKDNYYVLGSMGERWAGQGAEQLGLQGSVDKDVFTRLLEGRLPDGADLSRMQDGRNRHRPGYDLTFSAPKSVSMMAMLGGDKRLIEAHNQAVDFAVRQVEALASTRVMTDGQSETVLTGNLVAGLVMTVLTVGLVSCAGKSLPRFWPGDFFPTFYACHLAVLGVLAL